MGLAGLTAVFGMGTGVTPPVWSPGIRPPGDQTRPAAVIASIPFQISNFKFEIGDLRSRKRSRRWSRARQFAGGLVAWASFSRVGGPFAGIKDQLPAFSGVKYSRWYGLWEGERIGVVKRSAVGTGPLRRSPAVHFRPIDLVVFQEPS